MPTPAIKSARNLDQLLAAIREADVDGDLDLSDLPTFGGAEPPDTIHVWSWDEHRLIVGVEDLDIDPRAYWSSDLDTLAADLQAWFDHADLRDEDIDPLNVPYFGGDPPNMWPDVWSWDEDRLLFVWWDDDGRGRCKIVARDEAPWKIYILVVDDEDAETTVQTTGHRSLDAALAARRRLYEAWDPHLDLSALDDDPESVGEQTGLWIRIESVSVW
jgi:hypothetical protein